MIALIMQCRRPNFIKSAFIIFWTLTSRSKLRPHRVPLDHTCAFRKQLIVECKWRFPTKSSRINRLVPDSQQFGLRDLHFVELNVRGQSAVRAHSNLHAIILASLNGRYNCVVFPGSRRCFITEEMVIRASLCGWTSHWNKLHSIEVIQEAQINQNLPTTLGSCHPAKEAKEHRNKSQLAHWPCAKGNAP